MGEFAELQVGAESATGADVAPFLGRGAELRQLRAALAAPAARVAIWGIVGSGKSRLARQAALSWRPGSGARRVLVDLRGVSDPVVARDRVGAALASAIAGGGGAPLGPAAPAETLVVLDHADSLGGRGEAVAHRVGELIQASRVVLVARVPPAGRGWTALEVGPLDNGAAEHLFLSVLQAHLPPGFARGGEDFRDLVARLDGHPLCIARMAEHQAEVLVSGPGPSSGPGLPGPVSHALSERWSALAPELRRYAAQLTVFHGPFEPRDAAAVVGLDAAAFAPVLERLRAEQWVREAPAVDAPALVVPPLARSWLADATDLGSAPEARHAAWFARLGWQGSVDALDGPEGGRARARLRAARADLEAAWRWSGSVGDPATHVLLALAVAALVEYDGPQPWLGSRLESALVPAAGPELVARLHTRLAEFHRVAGRAADAERAAEQAVAAAAAAGDAGSTLARARRARGVIRAAAGDWESARGELSAVAQLAAAADDRRTGALAHADLARIERAHGSRERARRLAEMGTTLSRRGGHELAEAICLSALATIEAADRAFDGAARLHEQALMVYRLHGHRRLEADALANVAAARFAAGGATEALRLFQAALEIDRELGARWQECTVLASMAAVHLARLDPATARVEATEALRVARAVGHARIAQRAAGTLAAANDVLGDRDRVPG